MAQGKQDDGKKPARAGKKPRFNDVVFIQRELSAEESLACKRQVAPLEALDDSAMSLGDQGYRISLKWDTYGDCYGAWMQQTQDGKPNAGMCLTGRGSTPMKALKQLFFKHYVLLEENWADFREARSKDEIDD